MAVGRVRYADRPSVRCTAHRSGTLVCVHPTRRSTFFPMRTLLSQVLYTKSSILLVLGVCLGTACSSEESSPPRPNRTTTVQQGGGNRGIPSRLTRSVQDDGDTGEPDQDSNPGSVVSPDSVRVAGAQISEFEGALGVPRSCVAGPFDSPAWRRLLMNNQG